MMSSMLMYMPIMCKNGGWGTTHSTILRKEFSPLGATQKFPPFGPPQNSPPWGPPKTIPPPLVDPPPPKKKKI